MISINCTFGHSEPLGSLERTFSTIGLYGITGPNGSGKSTLLDTIAGEIEPLEGEVRISNQDPASSAGAGSVIKISEPVFYPDLTLGEHIQLLSKAAHFDFSATIEQWHLGPLLSQPPNRLSSGQRQRAFLATQLPLASKVIVLDEPERHLDENWLSILIGELKSKANLGAIVLVATHSTSILDACNETVSLG